MLFPSRKLCTFDTPCVCAYSRGWLPRAPLVMPTGGWGFEPARTGFGASRGPPLQGARPLDGDPLRARALHAYATDQPQFGNGATRLQRLALAGPVVARPLLRPRPTLGVGVCSYFASSPVSHTWQGPWPVSRVVGVYFKGGPPRGGRALGAFPLAFGPKVVQPNLTFDTLTKKKLQETAET
jgi:hypothetical protein